MSTEEFLPFALPDITDREVDEVGKVLRSGWITTGPRAKELERRFAEAVGAPHGVALNSCTAALHLALEALGLGPDDEVLVPTLTFAASAEVVRYFGARPVLVDIDARDHNIDVAKLERAVTPRTRVVMPVHFGGQACRMGPIMELARAKGLRVVEDAAHAFPTRLDGRMVGSLGDVTCFSFYATKTITTAEGGMAVTGNGEWADRMRVMSLHGISKDAWKRYTAEGSWFYEIVAPGFKYNMTDVAAAMGLVQLERTQEMLEGRRRIARAYAGALAGCDALETLDVRSFDEHAWHLFVVRLVDGVLAIDRARFIEELKARGVGSSVHFIPLHCHPYYRDLYGYKADDFPVALDCYRRSFSLPIYSSMSDASTARVIEAVLDIASRHRR
jgi:perosamine synthetase